MLPIIHAPLSASDPALPEIALPVERRVLAKRRWRGTADDGSEFGFELERPLRHGEVFFQTAAARYVIVQQPEPVLEIPLDLPASAAAGVGWAVGNLHLEFSSEPTRLLTPDEPAARQLLARIQISFHPATALFRPGRFARGAAPSAPAHDLGPSHRH